MPWNFAYGSNLHPDRLQGRCAVVPKRREPAVLEGWRLAFNLSTGMEWVEPAMANIMPAAGEAVHGVALEMSDAELERLVSSEGGSRWYRATPLEVETYDGERLSAVAFVAKDEMVRVEASPSQRYLGLIRDGADHHGLDPDYCAFLREHPAAIPNAFSPWIQPFFRAIDHPRAATFREAFMALVYRLALAEARRSKRRK